MSLGFGFGFPRRRPGSIAWTPAQIATALWLDASDASTITLNGSNVSSWADKSGNGRNVTQATAANQPPYSANGFNGKPCIDITAAPRYLRNIGSGTLPSVTISFIGQFANLLDTSRSVGYAAEDPAVSPNQSMMMAADGSLRFGGGMTASVAITTNPIIRVATRSPTLVQDFRDGNAAAISETAPATEIANRINIGNTVVDVALAGGTFTGKIAEVVFLASEISTENRQKLEGYFAWKWGLEANLPANHPYKLIPPVA